MPDEEETRTRAMAPATYEGGKWGGRYLRAPDIFFTVLEKGKGKLVRLGEIAEVRRGFTTGANEFFYLDDETLSEWQIEKEFLKPAVKSPRECNRILLNANDIVSRLFICHEERRDLRGTDALEYIKWGESQGYNERPTCRGRNRWWDLGERRKAWINVSYLVDQAIHFFAKEDGFYVGDNFQEIHIDSKLFWQLAVSANSTPLQLFANIVGRANFGGGLMKIQTYEIAGLQVVDPRLLEVRDCKTVLAKAQRLELDGADRRELDDVVFEALKLTRGERDAVYEAVVELVNKRLEKAGSV
jgi:hypothetical protein